jgi:hypothetical protein
VKYTGGLARWFGGWPVWSMQGGRRRGSAVVRSVAPHVSPQIAECGPRAHPTTGRSRCLATTPDICGVRPRHARSAGPTDHRHYQ